MYKAHLADSWYGALNVYNTSSIGSIAATWLYGTTDYQVCGYHKNVFGNTSTGSVAYFATATQDVNYNWSVGA